MPQIDIHKDRVEYATRWYTILEFYPNVGYLAVDERQIRAGIEWPKNVVILPEDYDTP